MRKRVCFVLAFTFVVLFTVTYSEASSVQGIPFWPPDADSDGMDDRWESWDFRSLGQVGDVDSDGDGLTDLQESQGWKIVIDCTDTAPTPSAASLPSGT
jgi:hypothetical protein